MILAGDCLAQLKTLPDASVQCCVTSPPYWGLRDYGVEGQLGLESTPDAYVQKMVQVFREVRRVLKDDGTCWVNLGDSYSAGSSNPSPKHSTDNVGMVRRVGDLAPKNLVGIPWRVAFALQADGWYLRSDIIWAKPNPMPESVTDRPTKAHEYLFLLTKSERYFYDAKSIGEPLSVEPHNPGNRFHAAKVAGPNDRGGHSQWEDTDRVWCKAGFRNKRSVWTIATQPYPAFLPSGVSVRVD